MKNKIDDLRNHLFATLEGLSDKDNPMDISRARAIAQVGSVIVNSAKTELQYMKLTGSAGTGFMPEAAKLPESAADGVIPGARVHRLKG